MKKLLFLLVLAFSSITLSAQTYQKILVQVWSSPGNAVANQPVWITAYNGTSVVKSSSGYSDNSSFGMYIDSIDASLTFDSLVAISYDCNGNKVKGTQSPAAPNSWFYDDTIYQSCPMSAFTGTAGFSYAPSTAIPNNIIFTDTSVKAGFAGNKSTFFCFFGDNDSSVVSSSFSHTYSAPGKYYVQYKFNETDTTGGGYNSDSWFRDTVEVLPYVMPTFCKAEFSVDTAQSINNKVVVYNNSSPASNDPSYTTTYHWDFGDGDTSNLPYPQHNYAQVGLYNLCLEIKSTDSLGATCISMYCDSLGVDSAGNIIYKGSGFVLDVLNPTIGLSEVSLGSKIEIFPNPFSDVLNATVVSAERKLLGYSIIDLKGAQVDEGTFREKNDVYHIRPGKLQSGVYILRLDDESGLRSHHRIVKQ